ncbi:MAG: SDR family NAD(P)-dependent oxidoreductase, partial [Hyphomicrobiaceae bacterium]|nr:SDR family NAD(P)-dependent oxidoreductase [Hyphomicrobiaceae bacterium]
MAVNNRLTDGLTGMAEGVLDAMMRFVTRRGQLDSAPFDRRIPAIVVTGGSAGIGLAIATAFAKRGRRVLLVARNGARLADAAATVTSKAALTAGIASLTLDVTTSDATLQIERALDRQGWTLDILVNAAGIGLSGPFVDHSEAEVGRLLATNVTALTTLTLWALPGLLARRSGGIINVASLAGYVPGPNQAAYYAS